MSARTHRVSILAIGTELTSGQITNRNAAWLSRKLVDLGAEVVIHKAVPDDRGLIRMALDHCSRHSSLIFVTGGLGPTTDDFTRDEVAGWAELPLEYHEPSWKKIVDRLTRFGVNVAESNRQQCYYPRGAKVLVNSQGTADAFTFERGETQVWVLPGPPGEIEAVWNECDLAGQVRARLPEGTQRFELLKWECLGKSEAELGEITEKALQGSGLQTGYRAHRPYVEVKVWIPEGQREKYELYLARLEKEIAPWIFCRGDEDLAANLLDLLNAEEEIEILDTCTGGMLAERLGSLLRKSENSEVSQRITFAMEWNQPESPAEWVADTLSQASPYCLTLAVAGVTPQGEWALGLREGDRVVHRAMQSPWKSIELIDRSRSFAVETSLKMWTEWLKGH